MRHRVNFLDMWIDKVSAQDAVAQIDAFVRAGVPRQVVTVNLDFLRIGFDDRDFRHLINTADLAVPDGMPLLWSSRLLGDALPERVAGVELVESCASLSARDGHTLFFLGARDGVAEEAAAVLRERYPGVRILGTYAPPMSAFSDAEDERTIRLIQELAPDILFVAFGAPRQDAWIRKHMQRLNVPVCMGVGGTFDMLAGRVRRAPVWMQRSGMEWAYRLLQEPGRLWKRYFVNDLPILFRLMVQRWTGTAAARGAVGIHVETETLVSSGDTLIALSDSSAVSMSTAPDLSRIEVPAESRIPLQVHS